MDFAEEFGYIISHNVFLNVGSFSNLGERSEWIFFSFSLFIYGQVFNRYWSHNFAISFRRPVVWQSFVKFSVTVCTMISIPEFHALSSHMSLNLLYESKSVIYLLFPLHEHDVFCECQCYRPVSLILLKIESWRSVQFIPHFFYGQIAATTTNWITLNNTELLNQVVKRLKMYWFTSVAMTIRSHYANFFI
jgi:hypothetical protein